MSRLTNLGFYYNESWQLTVAGDHGWDDSHTAPSLYLLRQRLITRHKMGAQHMGAIFWRIVSASTGITRENRLWTWVADTEERMQEQQRIFDHRLAVSLAVGSNLGEASKEERFKVFAQLGLIQHSSVEEFLHQTRLDPKT